MWFLFVLLYIILAVIFTQFYKITTKSSKNPGALTVILQVLSGIVALLLCPFFKFSFPTDWRIYLFLGIACCFYAISDRINTTVRGGIEASTFSIIKQLSTVFMIIAGLLFFKEKFVLKKIIGAILILLSNVIIFYKKGKQKFNKYILLAILANMAFSIALFLDVNISEKFNLGFYVAITLIVPALLIILFERIKISNILSEFKSGNKKSILITGISWSTMIIVQLIAYQLGDVTTVAPLCALTIIGNVIVGYLFLGERDNLLKKVIAAFLVIISVILIKG